MNRKPASGRRWPAPCSLAFSLKRTNFEFTVPEKRETAHLLNIQRAYRGHGLPDRD